MKKIPLNKKKIIALFALLIFSVLEAHVVWAIETFQNSLVKVELNETPTGGVSVNLYTSKPYKDIVSATKKNDFKYVILLPETSNSVITQPMIKPQSGVITNVEIKSQSYSNNIKGYTKVVILTTKPINITPHIQTINKQAKPSTTVQTVKPITTLQKTVVASKHQVSQPLAAKSETRKTSVKETAKHVIIPTQKVISASKPPVITQKIKAVQKRLAPVYKEPVNRMVNEVQPMKQVQRIPEESVVTPTADESQTQGIQRLSVPQEEIQSPPIVQSNETLTPQNSTVQPQIQSEVITPTVKPERKIQKIKRTVKKIIIKAKSSINLYTLGGFALIVLLSILAILRSRRKNAQNIKQQTPDFIIKDAIVPPSPVQDYNEDIENIKIDIPDDMTWREKFQTYVETPKEEPQEQSHQEKELNNLVNNHFLSDNEIKDNITEGDIRKDMEQNDKNIPENEVISFEDDSILDELGKLVEDRMEKDVSVEDVFGDEEQASLSNNLGFIPPSETIPPAGTVPVYSDANANELIFNEPTEEDIGQIQEVENVKAEDIIQSEFPIDNEKGFYLVDYHDSTALVGHIADEIFVLKKFNVKVSGKIQARLDEKKENASNYMTKVGDFKGIVEVTPNKMNLLIEL